VKPPNTTSYIQKYQIIKDKYYGQIQMSDGFDIVNVYAANENAVCCGADGRILLTRNSVAIEEFGYRHGGRITFIDADLDEELLWTGDMQGRIIAANGTIDTEFDKMI
jgi:hypothetical protein